MLEIVDPRKPKTAAERGRSLVPARLPDLLEATPAVPLISRDAYVAETSTRVDQIERQLKAVAGQMAAIKGELARVREDSDQTRRFYDFLEREARTKSAEASEMVRLARDAKARLDRIEAKTGGDYHGYSTFEAVSKRLTELGEVSTQVGRARRDLKISAAVLCAALLAALWTVYWG